MGLVVYGLERFLSAIYVCCILASPLFFAFGWVDIMRMGCCSIICMRQVQVEGVALRFVVKWMDHGIHIKGQKHMWHSRNRGLGNVRVANWFYLLLSSTYIYWYFWEVMALVSLRNCTT